VTDVRLTEAELAELERLLVNNDSHQIHAALLALAPRLITAARLANEQAERIEEMMAAIAAADEECQ
jgi:hypothetical protein